MIELLTPRFRFGWMVVVGVVFWGGSNVALSQQEISHREDELFGEENLQPDDALKPQEQLSDKLEEIDDRLALGGQLYMRFQYNLMDEGSFEEHPVTSPNLLHLYIDARPHDRLRAFVRGRLKYDFTIEPGQKDLFDRSIEPTQVWLDQFWLKFDLYRKIFVTLGRQPARWGSGRFWNPTDFLNRQQRDPLAIFDERLGVSLLKIHVPLESLNWNLYAVVNLDDASSPEKMGGALRAEMLFDKTELAVSVAARKDQPFRVGLDLSTAVGIFDLRLEGAVAHNQTTPFWRGRLEPQAGRLPYPVYRDDDWIAQVTAGAEVALLYSDQDSLYLGIEYFYNDAAYEDPNLYPWLALQGAFIPFYLGRNYASAYAMLLNPGDWNNTSFILSAIGNLSDKTWIIRFDYQVTVLTYLQLSSFATLHLGEQGEFHYTVDLAATEDFPGLEQGLYIPAVRAEIGLWLRVDF